MSRAVRVYRLEISYPPGSDDPAWVPACWGEMLAGVRDRAERRALRRRGFRWPRERLYLSASGAWSRAALLTMLGAVVSVQRSEEVTWWQDADAMDWWPYPDPAYAEPGPEYTDRPFKLTATGVRRAMAGVRRAMAGIIENEEGIFRPR